MQLTVVGCAGSVPGPDSAGSCYLVEADGQRVLLDLGTGAAGPLQRHADPAALDAVLISHAHADHCADLSSIAYLRHRVGAAPLDVYGPANLRDALNWRHPAPQFAFHELPSGALRLGPLEVTVAAVEHGIEAYAFRVGDALCYSGDTAPCDALDELAQGCAVLLAEGAGFDDTGVPRHLTAGDAGRLAARSGARLLVLTHLRSWLDHERLLDEAARFAGCPVLLAQPGLRLRV
ncbi:MBL fold metallo-hydrolase [Catellatospora methionotrophica]|uniref:MBL fold metallo-hydrolase n=1 Tax=Catellatospora methionotrophica TaxID=121620 RepID=A0A8J3LAF3_9ACTN|nr:MBL fold metallo-hydrolase [Catellatospora methionotrophica]GIG17322.1 MBL fold metallo-hydrolase [Catellatospora methionotrophica]